MIKTIKYLCVFATIILLGAGCDTNSLVTSTKSRDNVPNEKSLTSLVLDQVPSQNTKDSIQPTDPGQVEKPANSVTASFDSSNTIKADQNQDTITRVFQIHSLSPNDPVYNLTVDIPKVQYINYQNSPLGHKYDQTINVASWVTPNDPSIKKIAEDLRELYLKNSNYFFINSVFEIIRSIKYTSDSTINKDGEYWKFPVETLVEGKGDCEDTSFLASAIFGAIGWNTIVIRFPGHIGMAIEIPDVVMKSFGNDVYIPFSYYNFQGHKYYYVETTNLNDFKLAEIPAQIKGTDFAYYSVTIPTITPEPYTNQKKDFFSSSTEWKEYSYPEKEFSISLPGVPDHKTEYYQIAKYDIYRICAEQICYFVQMWPIHKEDNSNGPIMTLKQNKELFQDDFPNFTFVNAEEKYINNYYVYNFQLTDTKNNGQVKIKMVEGNNYYYQLRAVYIGDSCKEKNCEDFFNSFKIISN